jgi:hypothetical protein
MIDGENFTELRPLILLHLQRAFSYVENALVSKTLPPTVENLTRQHIITDNQVIDNYTLVIGVFSPTRWKTSAMLYFFPTSVVVSK